MMAAALMIFGLIANGVLLVLAMVWLWGVCASDVRGSGEVRPSLNLPDDQEAA